MLRLVLLRLMESYFRHRWLYLIPILIMGVAAFVSFSTAKPSYISDGVLFVQKESLLAMLTSVKDSSYTWQTPATLTVGELKELIQTDSFMRAVIQNTDLEENMSGGQEAVKKTIEDVRKDVWVIALGDNQVRVGAVQEQPQIAYQLVTGIIDTFLKWKINADRTESEAAHEFFTALILKYKGEVDLARQNLADYLISHPAPIKGERDSIEQLEIDRLMAELTLAQARYASALDKDEDAQLATAQAEGDVLQSYVLLDSPILPEKPDVSLKQIAINLGVFLGVGLFFSVLGIVGAAFLDRSLRFPVDVWHGVQLPVLASVSSIPPLSIKVKKKHRWAREVVNVELDETVVTASGTDSEKENHQFASEGNTSPGASSTIDTPLSFETIQTKPRKKGRGVSTVVREGKLPESLQNNLDQPENLGDQKDLANSIKNVTKESESIEADSLK